MHIYNQGMLNHVNVSLEYALKIDAPDVREGELLDDVVSAVNQRSDSNVYWEILSVSIAEDLIQKHPSINYLTLNLEVAPRATIPYVCNSTVTRWANGKTEERWSFTASDIPVVSDTMNARVSYSYRENANYPDFLDIRTRLIEHLGDLAATDLPLEQLESMLAQRLGQDYLEKISAVRVDLR